VPIWILSASLVLRGSAAAEGSGRRLAVAGAAHALAIGWFSGAMLFAVLRTLRDGCRQGYRSPSVTDRVTATPTM